MKQRIVGVYCVGTMCMDVLLVYVFFLFFVHYVKMVIYSQTIKGAVNVFLIEYNVHKSPSMFIFVA